MALVGNGFDLQVLQHLNAESSTSYENFFYFVKSRNFNSDNVILAEMDKLRGDYEDAERRGDKDTMKVSRNWSDLEKAIDSLANADTSQVPRIRSDLQAVQSEFTKFLNSVVTSDILARLSEESRDGRLALASVSKFLKDLDADSYQDLAFKDYIYNNEVFNYLFVNFNYTSLLDNYIYLDQDQFDPNKYHTSGNNFQFLSNPNGFRPGPASRFHEDLYSIAFSEVTHPHGRQEIPRSMLLGIDLDEYGDTAHDPKRPLIKGYWARTTNYFGHLFADTELFVIFGCSLGATDGWWWRNILETLLADGHEAIVYWWHDSIDGRPDKNSIKERLVDGACATIKDQTSKDDARERYAAAFKKIHVVLHSPGEETTWLGLTPHPDIS